MNLGEPAAAGFNAERLKRLSVAFQAEIDRGLLPGVVSLVARRGKVVHFESAGRLDPEQAAPMPADAVFRIYSMTKPLTSVAAMMLVEEGRLMLHEPVSTWLPEFDMRRMRVSTPDGLAQEPARAAITVHDLLRHTSGLTYAFLGDHPVQRRYAEAGIGAPTSEMAGQSQTLAGLPLLCQPGSAWAYGHSTDVLGRVIEVITGQTLGQVLHQRILHPLGMHDTDFQVPASQHHRIAEPFRLDPQGGEPVNLLDVRSTLAFESGGGGLVSTASDYARFLQCLLNGGSLGPVRLLGAKTLQWMTADHLGPLPALGEVLPAGHGFGLGFAVRRGQGLASLPGSAGLYYWGGIAGTTFFVDPAEQLFGVLMIQAPLQRVRYRALFRQLIYAALDD